MLTILRIRNLALVHDLTLELRPGYNAITGETGAGKSILIGALNLVLGDRAERGLIRSGADSCAVEAVFDINRVRGPIPRLLEENGLEPCSEEQLVVKRTCSATGANRQFVNGSPTTLQVLDSLGQWLVDIHGPHDHQSLLHPARQLALLDAFAGLDTARERFGRLAAERRELERRRLDLGSDDQTYQQQLDLLRHQVREIEAARLQPAEDQRIEQEFHRLSNSARLLQLSQAALSCLSDDEQGVLNRMDVLGKVLHELRRLDAAVEPLHEAEEQARSALRELQTGLARYADHVELDPGRLQELEERLNVLQSLKRKYGPKLDQVMAFGENAQQKLKQLEQRDGERARLSDEIRKTDEALWEAGQQLSGQRQRAISRFNRAVTRQLRDLGFHQSQFDVQLASLSRAAVTAMQFPSSGLDSLEFIFAPNPGEPPRGLRTIASSGEMARVMLALKTVLAAEDEVPVLIFDEVDANVGGETSAIVGEKMRQIGANHQVLCITHLAPVAACASAHFVVSKRIQEGRTVTEVQPLEGSDRIQELARMLGGRSEAALQHARALLAHAATLSPKASPERAPHQRQHED
ncbi:MAG TPA: DNA repair protein RecN [Candidatus Paceibacterota bacterium]|nr:DNA repair protein RecN [Verrucomicrobiota bacterium]HRY46633.1 DNA repair protein RecN [Candidatus Paceibacterota bacterium]